MLVAGSGSAIVPPVPAVGGEPHQSDPLGRVSLAQFETAVRDLVPELAEIMDRFGSPQIKNAGTLAGKIVLTP